VAKPTEYDQDVVSYAWVMVTTRFCPVKCIKDMTGFPRYKLACGHYQYEHGYKAPGNKREKLKVLSCRACAEKAVEGVEPEAPRRVAHGLLAERVDAPVDVLPRRDRLQAKE
jgi:hypothetical protein